jgi:hypothetical protein
MQSSLTLAPKRHSESAAPGRTAIVALRAKPYGKLRRRSELGFAPRHANERSNLSLKPEAASPYLVADSTLY